MMRSLWAFVRVSVSQQECHVKLGGWKAVCGEACVSSRCCFIGLRRVSELAGYCCALLGAEDGLPPPRATASPLMPAGCVRVAGGGKGS